jgi:hypothetical protein
MEAKKEYGAVYMDSKRKEHKYEQIYQKHKPPFRDKKEYIYLKPKR